MAATGRLSSANPNLQNIPVRTELGQRIRRAFVAAPGHLLLVADYSQIELRILAHIAGEEALIAAFRAGEDVHRATAASVFGVAPELVTADQRRAAKTINFGIIYGMSAFGLGQNLRIPPKQAEQFITAYFARYPGVKRYIEETLAAAERDGKVETLYGRVRHLPDVHSKNYNLRENARRMAINARIQGTAADLLKKAMVAVAPAPRRRAAGEPAAADRARRAGARGAGGRGGGGRRAGQDRDGRGRRAGRAAGRRRRLGRELVRGEGVRTAPSELRIAPAKRAAAAQAPSPP